MEKRYGLGHLYISPQADHEDHEDALKTYYPAVGLSYPGSTAPTPFLHLPKADLSLHKVCSFSQQWGSHCVIAHTQSFYMGVRLFHCTAPRWGFLARGENDVWRMNKIISPISPQKSRSGYVGRVQRRA